MKRKIEPLVVVEKVNENKLKEYMAKAAKEVDMSLPQPADMAVAYVANQQNIPIVSSDWRLVEVAQQLGLEAMMNSAFLVMLMEEEKDPQNEQFLEELYEKLFSEEITYSVKSQGRYDPVVRIQKIVDSALDVVRLQGKPKSKGKKIEVQKEHDFQEYNQLHDLTKDIREDIDKYISLIEEGDYKRAKFELKESINRLTDLGTEVRMKEVQEEDPVYKESLTTIAHLILLLSAIALGEQRLSDAEALVDQLLLIMLENNEVEERLDIEIHLQRITIFFLTEQLNRLKNYFSPAFIELCRDRERDDVLQLHRTMGIIAAVISNNQTEPTATAKDFSEIQYIIQLGVQFIAVNKIEYAWLLLEQAIYMSINSKMTGLLYAVFEVLLPLSFKPEVNYEPTIEELLQKVKEEVEELPYDDYKRRMERNEVVKDKMFTKSYLPVEEIPTQLQGFLEIISAQHVDFKKIGRTTFVRAIDWQTMHMVGIVDPSLSLDTTLTVGSSVKLYSGKFKIMKPSKSLKKKRNVDLLILAKPDNLKFVVRRAGQLSVAQSKVGEFDL